MSPTGTPARGAICLRTTGDTSGPTVRRPRAARRFAPYVKSAMRGARAHPTRYSTEWANSPTKDMNIEQYAELLQRAVGTTFENEWSPAMLGPHFPKPRVGFNVQVTRDSIRHLADAIGDLNPLYRDTEYAA